jgi:hypothetical protein
MRLAAGKLVWNVHPLASIGRRTGNEMEPSLKYVDFYLQAVLK